MIRDITWNHDAADHTKAFIHVMAEGTDGSEERLVIEVEHRPQRVFYRRWMIGRKNRWMFLVGGD